MLCELICFCFLSPAEHFARHLDTICLLCLSCDTIQLWKVTSSYTNSFNMNEYSFAGSSLLHGYLHIIVMINFMIIENIHIYTS
jgi:hypothetical protein